MRSVRFLVDALLPPALARALVQAGHLADHVGDAGLLEAGDEAIWQHAQTTGAVIITKDEDFVHRQKRASEQVCVVWVRIGNASRRALLQPVLPLMPQLISLLDLGETLIEIR